MSDEIQNGLKYFEKKKYRPSEHTLYGATNANNSLSNIDLLLIFYSKFYFYGSSPGSTPFVAYHPLTIKISVQTPLKLFKYKRDQAKFSN